MIFSELQDRGVGMRFGYLILFCCVGILLPWNVASALDRTFRAKLGLLKGEEQVFPVATSFDAIFLDDQGNALVRDSSGNLAVRHWSTEPNPRAVPPQGYFWFGGDVTRNFFPARKLLAAVELARDIPEGLYIVQDRTLLGQYAEYYVAAFHDDRMTLWTLGAFDDGSRRTLEGANAMLQESRATNAAERNYHFSRREDLVRGLALAITHNLASRAVQYRIVSENGGLADAVYAETNKRYRADWDARFPPLGRIEGERPRGLPPAVDRALDLALSENVPPAIGIRIFLASIIGNLDCPVPEQLALRTELAGHSLRVTLELGIGSSIGALDQVFNEQDLTAAAGAIVAPQAVAYAGFLYAQGLECDDPAVETLYYEVLHAFRLPLGYMVRDITPLKHGCFAVQRNEVACECLADGVRAAIPDIDQRSFDLQLMGDIRRLVGPETFPQCGVDPDF